MSDWICPRCGDKEPFYAAFDHECKRKVIICDTCFLTKPCECDDD